MLALLGRPATLVALAAILVVATLTVVWLGFRATTAWKASVVQVVERRASEKVALLAAALNHDMKGAAGRVLVPLNGDHLAFQTPHDLASIFARAFARFPYPESFFVWRNSPDGGHTVVFNRADRTPPWAPAHPSSGRYPVVLLTEAPQLDGVLARTRNEAEHRMRFVVFEALLAGDPYQTVVHLLYDGSRPRLLGAIGFLVNLNWARRHYFDELTRQVSSIGGGRDDLSLAILDADGKVVASTAPMDGTHGNTRAFPLLFFDPALLLRQRTPQPIEFWTARVTSSGDRALAAAAEGADRLRGVMSLATVATLAALLLTARSVRVNAELATTKTEFVSAVTHELKTPLSLIRLVADTLAQKRYRSEATVGEYARLLGKESSNLGLLIDNLLMFARMSDVRTFYGFGSVAIDELLEDALKRFRLPLTDLGFEISVATPPDLPPVRADRPALLHALENLIDNAIRYSESARVLALSACRKGDFVQIDVTDHGVGIPPDERARVFEKFYRSRTVHVGGTGLGLTIVHRVVRDHGGRVVIRGRPEGGTTVEVSLPLARTNA